MRSLSVSVLTAALANAAALGLAAWLLDGFDIRRWWFVFAVVLFTVLTVALRRAAARFVPTFARTSAIIGGLVVTTIALVITDVVVPERGFDIEGTWSWILVVLMVWAAGVAYGEVDAQAPADVPPVTPSAG